MVRHIRIGHLLGVMRKASVASLRDPEIQRFKFPLNLPRLRRNLDLARLTLSKWGSDDPWHHTVPNKIYELFLSFC